jgi:hypothetical protein
MARRFSKNRIRSRATGGEGGYDTASDGQSDSLRRLTSGQTRRHRRFEPVLQAGFFIAA